MKQFILLLSLLYSFFVPAQRVAREKTEVLVIGGGAGGTAAAIQSARMGAKTVLVESTKMLGGMLTAAGISCTDGNDQLPSGIWEEFRQALYRHYGRNKLNTGWVSNTSFEPHIGDSIFKSLVSKEKNLTVFYTYEFVRVTLENNKTKSAYFINQRRNHGLDISAEVIVDATELGDVFAAAGASYDLGIDSQAVTGEKQEAVIQDITWAAILKDYGDGTDKTIPQPKGYDAVKYYCCCTDAPCNGQAWNGDKMKMLNYGKLPRSPGATHDKYMLNWPAHGNDIYMNVVEENSVSRNKKYEQAKDHTLGFIYFMQTRLGMKNIGPADDELDKGLAWIPYNREGRRVKGVVRMDISHVKDPYSYKLYRTGIAVGDYPVDHHHAKYPGKMPELDFSPIPSYTIPLGALIPEKMDALIVCEKGISVSNIVNGTTRLQPVVLLTGQAAGVLAARSVKENKKVRDLNVRTVQSVLLQAKCYLMPFADVKPSDPYWEAIQKTGVMGILKGTGKPEGWSNKMFFYPDSSVNGHEFIKGLSEYAFNYFSHHRLHWSDKQRIVDCYYALERLRSVAKSPDFRKVTNVSELKKNWERWGLSNFDPERLITRRELSVMLDKCTVLFGTKNILLDTYGSLHFLYTEF
jgi:hypothetical protein